MCVFLQTARKQFVSNTIRLQNNSNNIRKNKKVQPSKVPQKSNKFQNKSHKIQNIQTNPTHPKKNWNFNRFETIFFELFGVPKRGKNGGPEKDPFKTHPWRLRWSPWAPKGDFLVPIGAPVWRQNPEKCNPVTHA